VPADLDDIFARQRQLQVESFGITPWELKGEDKRAFVVTMALASMAELIEMLAHINWKSWTSDEPGIFYDRDKYVKEGVDMLHFFVNLMLVADADGNEVYSRYFRKATVNAERQAAGYDGRSTKDPVTGEALDEPD